MTEDRISRLSEKVDEDDSSSSNRNIELHSYEEKPPMAGNQEKAVTDEHDAHSELRARLDRAEAQNAQLRASIERYELINRELRDSTSWRLTAPLRSLSLTLSSLLHTRGSFALAFYRRLRPIRRSDDPTAVIAATRANVHPSDPKASTFVAVAGETSATAAIPIAPEAPEFFVRRGAIRKWSKIERFANRAPELHSSTYDRDRVYTPQSLSTLKDQSREYQKAASARTSAADAAVFSANCGRYDSIKHHEFLDAAFDYHLFVDRPIAKSDFQQLHGIAYHHDDPTRRARYIKTHPHIFLPEYEYAIWIDSSILIRGDLRPLFDNFRSSGAAIGAVPHPFRNSVYEEAFECIERGKDDRAVIIEQLERYDRQDFAGLNVVESGFLMFNLKHPDLARFLNLWWKEIDRGSKRDQLSFSYALDLAGLRYFPLTEKPNSVRNHPSLALIAHHSQLSNTEIPNDDRQGTFNPLEPATNGRSLQERLALQQGIDADIVICVHNALQDVTSCLESIDDMRSGGSERIIIVDDASDDPTKEYLAGFAAGRPYVDLLRNEAAVGYCKAANIGLRHSSASMVVLLNSDTIVTKNWVLKLADALSSAPDIGLAGPISNAASHQSIPEHNSRGGNTAINEIPAGFTIDDMNSFCESWTKNALPPRVPLVHGFCFAISRELINAIGYLDEDTFPKGYGEENDYCFRASDAGFGLVVATNTFVFHAKSKSYPSALRKTLMKKGGEALRSKHGTARVDRSVRSMVSNPQLVSLRAAAAAMSPEPTSSATKIQ